MSRNCRTWGRHLDKWSYHRHLYLLQNAMNGMEVSTSSFAVATFFQTGQKMDLIWSIFQSYYYEVVWCNPISWVCASSRVIKQHTLCFFLYCFAPKTRAKNTLQRTMGIFMYMITPTSFFHLSKRIKMSLQQMNISRAVVGLTIHFVLSEPSFT